jgi:hypothetical protein
VRQQLFFKEEFTLKKDLLLEQELLTPLGVLLGEHLYYNKFLNLC